MRVNLWGRFTCTRIKKQTTWYEWRSKVFLNEQTRMKAETNRWIRQMIQQQNSIFPPQLTGHIRFKLVSNITTYSFQITSYLSVPCISLPTLFFILKFCTCIDIAKNFVISCHINIYIRTLPSLNYKPRGIVIAKTIANLHILTTAKGGLS